MDLKSQHSTEKVYLRFFNKTTRLADVFWVDFDGAPVRYHTLKPDKYVDIDTYVNHPWIAKDHSTKDKLSIANDLCFIPPSWEEIFLKTYSKLPEGIPPHRIIVMITLPMYSLRERCLQVVRDHCVELNVIPEVLTQLEHYLPKSVYDDLLMKFLQNDGIYVE